MSEGFLCYPFFVESLVSYLDKIPHFLIQSVALKYIVLFFSPWYEKYELPMINFFSESLFSDTTDIWEQLVGFLSSLQYLCYVVQWLRKMIMINWYCIGGSLKHHFHELMQMKRNFVHTEMQTLLDTCQ